TLFSRLPNCITFILPVLKACILDSYIAAVYEHLIILSEGTKIPVSPEDALMLMNKNMDVLKGAIRTAALQGACIIVPPEDGIYSWVFARETVYSYLEDFPDPQVTGFHVETLKDIVCIISEGRTPGRLI
uniref:CN hydrolase domain-containing protein n=1 Tax=Gopherus agassizii TaxID=38772 RepID=A0A452HS92_9SAUR